ncbi:MAG: PP2C family protein-serine/threonine phosphatase [Terriglobales bacterium]
MLFGSRTAAPAPARIPLPSVMPQVPSAELGARYRQARVGGDFFDFVPLGQRLAFVLLDVAGRRAVAMAVAATVQDTLRALVPELLADGAANVSLALTEIALRLNRTILAGGEVRCTPTFLACYDYDAGTLWYVNAGHVAPIVKDASGTCLLPATGLPLGLFSHATQDAAVCALAPGDVLVAASRGIIEARGPRREEFGLERLQEFIAEAEVSSADALCATVLDTVCTFISQQPNGISRLWSQLANNEPGNDLTVIALHRTVLS